MAERKLGSTVSRPRDHDWKCCGCGQPGQKQTCDCFTSSIYRRVDGVMQVSSKDMRPMLVDSKCVELAEHFLSDVPGFAPEHLTALGEAIQDCVETYMSGLASPADAGER